MIFRRNFRDAMQGSYLEANFQVGSEVIHFEPEQLRRIVLEYGEAIMHAQFIYNSYLKNTPWEIDFELLISKEGKLLSPQEHYLIANELQRNGIKFAALGSILWMRRSCCRKCCRPMPLLLILLATD